MYATCLIGLLYVACDRERGGAIEDEAGFRWGRLSSTSTSRFFARVRWGQGGSDRPEAIREVVRAGHELDRRATKEATASAFHEAGVFRLLLGRHDEAVHYLQDAVERGGGGAARSDLAAAYLARGELADRPMDFVRAASMSEGPAEPASHALQINIALALRRLGLRREAARRVERCLPLETDPRWRDRLRDLVAELRQPTFESQWRPIHERWVRRVEDGQVDDVREIVHKFPYRARLLGEEALGHWANAELDGDVRRAAQWLDMAGRIGRQLAGERGEALLSEAVRTIHEQEDDPATRRRLVDAHLAFHEGLERFDADDTTAAERLFERAAELFAETPSPFGLWAKLQTVLCLYYSDAAGALVRFEQLSREVDAHRFPALAGRLAWLLGSASKTRQAHDDALRHYRRAFALLDKASGAEQSAFIRVLIAETLQAIGDGEAAWRERISAMEEVSSAAPPRRVMAMLLEAAWALAEAGADSAALLVLEELESRAQEIGAPFHLGIGYLYQGFTQARLDQNELALQSLDRARRAMKEVPAGPLRDGLDHRIKLATGLALRRDDPDRALELLAEAMRGEAAIGQDFYRVHSHLASAEAQAARGDLPAAQKDFLAAAEAYEATRDRLEDVALRISAARAAQSALEVVLTLPPVSAPPAPESFRFAERLRARELMARAAAWSDGDAAPPAASAVAAALGPDVAVVHYTTLPDRVLCWVLRREETHGLHLPIRREDLFARVRRLRTALEREAAEEELRPLLRDLHELLLRPLEPAVAGARALVFVPDRELSSVPFTALLDPSTDRYLIEDYVTTIAPSATLLLLHQRRPGKLRFDNALLVGSGRMSRRRAELSDLFDVEEEIRGVAAAHDRPIVLLDEEATPARFLASLTARDLVHFAGHALVNPERPEASILVLHPENGDDDVRISEALDHGLAGASLVVLSACRTMDQELETRETPLGVAGIVYAAGVPAVLAGRLDVEDRLAARWMPRFHRALGRRLSPARAFQLSLTNLLAEERVSPAQWSALSMVGGAQEHF